MAVSSNELNEWRKDVERYKPGLAVKCPDEVKFPERLHIGLFGMTGCGKSSLINSLMFTTDGTLKQENWLQVAPQVKAGGHSIYRRAVHITNGIYAVDNRGLDDASTDAALNEIGAQLGGYPMAVITNVDLVDESRVEELRTVLQVNGISDIFEVANITKEKVKLEETYQQSLLSFLKRCMVVGDESYIFKHHLSTKKAREREMMDRRDRIKREHQEQKRRTEEDETFQKLNVAMEKMMDENTVKDHYYKAIQKVECKHAPQVTVVAQKKKGDSTGGLGDSTGGLAALGAGATAGALMGSVAGPPGAAIGAAAGAILSGVGYLFGKKE